MQQIFDALRLNDEFEQTGEGALPSRYQVTNLGVASIGAVGLALAELCAELGFMRPQVSVDRRLASLWMGQTLYPQGWDAPPIWDAVAGDYQTRDGWIRLHTNLRHHRTATLGVLDAPVDRLIVAEKVAAWDAQVLEDAVVAAGGVAAKMNTRVEWDTHPQGQAVASEPLINWQHRPGQTRGWQPDMMRPLHGLKVLDLTRVIAGPVATRTLAAFGAEVLRIDPIGFTEGNVEPEVTLGKRCARLDLKSDEGKAQFEALLADADVLVHGYRPDALSKLGYDAVRRATLAPQLIEVCLDAYGWTGPWAGRRGFDSLVQMSSGIAHAGMLWANAEKPTPLPVQALDHATGYLMAATVLRALADAVAGNGLAQARLSLARTAALLVQHEQHDAGTLTLTPAPSDLSMALEQTSWGPAHRLHPPLTLSTAMMQWDSPAVELGSHSAKWR